MRHRARTRIWSLRRPVGSNHLNQKRGPNLWKFKTALLKDEAYVTALKMNIPMFKEKYNESHDLGLKWDLIKWR